MCWGDRNEIQVGPNSLFVFQLCADWLHLPETHSPEIPATDHRHPRCTTFCWSGHHQRGKVRHLTPLAAFLNQPFSWVSFAPRDTRLGMPSLLSANSKPSCSEKKTKDCFSLCHCVLSHTSTKCDYVRSKTTLWLHPLPHKTHELSARPWISSLFTG